MYDTPNERGIRKGADLEMSGICKTNDKRNCT